MNFKVLVVVTVLLSFNNTLTAQSALTGRLDNGMEVALLENHAAPMIAMNIITDAGSREETWDTWGASHFLEHLLFNGTETRTQEEIYAQFDRIGAYNNAHTGSHFTDFILVVSQDHFPEGFEIMTDMIFHSTLPVEKFEKERGIVIEEMARSASMGYDAGSRFDEMLYGDSPLTRNVLGSVSSITQLERDSVLAFYHRWYVPNNMLLFATGDFDADTLFAWLQEKMLDVKPHDLPQRRVIEKPDFRSLAGMGLVFQASENEKISLNIAYEAPLPGDPDYPAFQLLANYLDQQLSLNLPDGCKVGNEISLDPDFATFKCYLSGAKDGLNALEMQKVFDKTINDVIKKPLSDADIQRLARSYYAERVFSGEMLSHYGIMHAAYWALVPWEEFTSWPDRMRTVTPIQLANVARKWLKDADRFSFCLEPASKGEATEESAKTKFSASTEENGMRVVGIEDASAQIFALHLLFRDRWKFDQQYGSVDLLHRSLAQFVPKGYSSLDERLDELGAQLKFADDPMIPFDDYYTSPSYSFIRLEVLPDRWQEAVLLLGEIIRMPITDDKTVEIAKQGVISARRSFERSAARQGIQYLRQNLIPGNYLTFSVYGNTDDIGIRQINELGSEYLKSSNIIATWVGPVDPAEVQKILNRNFRNTGKSKLSPEYGTETVTHEQITDTLNLGLPQGALVMGKKIADVKSSDRAAIIVANAYLNERISSVIREELGLAYSLGSSFTILTEDSGKPSGLWEMSVSTRAENIPQAKNALEQILSNIQSHEFTQDEVDKLANAIGGRLLMRSMSRISQAYSMAMGEYFSNEPLDREKLIEELSSVDSQSVMNALSEYFQPDNMSYVVVE